MKIRVLALCLIAGMVLGGCAVNAERLDSAGAQVKKMIGTAGDAVESAAINRPSAAETTAAMLTKEEAEAIALEHAGLTADQVTWLRTEYEIDDGVPQYEVEFHQGQWEYGYEINAETGEIMSYDKDD